MLFFVLVFLSVVVLSLSYFVANYFTGEGITDAVMYHLKYGLAGAGFFEYRYLIIGSALFLLTCLTILFFLIRASRRQEPRFLYSFLSIFPFVATTSEPTESFPEIFEIS